VTLPKWVVRRPAYRRAAAADPLAELVVLGWIRELAAADAEGEALLFVERAGLHRRQREDVSFLVRVTFYEDGHVRMVDLWELKRAR
jgi:hypothetical protein